MENTLDGYRKYLENQELTEGTQKIYIRYAKDILKYSKGQEIIKKTVVEYKREMKKRGAAPSTINLAVIAVNKYLKFAGNSNSTVKTEKIQKRSSLENVLNSDEYYRLLAAAKNSGRYKYYCIMKTLAQTGIRISELSYFTVEILKEYKIQVTNKGKTRDIYLPDSLLQELGKYCEKEKITSGTIFRGTTGGPIGRSAIYKMFLRIGKLAGVSTEKIYPHSFRHLFAVTYMNQYSNLTELADILGHSSLETTRIYTLTTAEEKRKRMDHLGL